MKKHLPLIYILGNSHSGSTLVSFLIGAHPKVCFKGEIKLKSFTDPNHKICTCGRPYQECPYWSEVQDQMKVLKSPLFPDREKNKFFRSVFWGQDYRISKEDQNRIEQIYSILENVSRQNDPEVIRLLDSSKSLWWLHGWLSVGRIPVKIIWVRRNLKGNVSSFVKRGTSFVKSTASVVTNDYLIAKYLKRNQLPYLEVTDEQLENDFNGTFSSIGNFLDLSYDQVDFNAREFHILNGNTGARAQFDLGFKGFETDDRWRQILGKSQQNILSTIDYIRS